MESEYDIKMKKLREAQPELSKNQAKRMVKAEIWEAKQAEKKALLKQ